ncbi:hypothetical protein SAZ_10755 [Streptomyces noursei ZPM]|uniref:Uncharacterized protein n=1 Tax=Streptomyces noursei TaxID=1971 RepID=A0A401QXU4_STRNR|nr:hypothetical protein [Streptomyces noursei]AKA08617.1 hypothetical protein SAZ_10755 [Streptomyces noursei ZPM]EOT04887.1 hypothetical protein K530_06260 [Streptomyces noursei CCRC 11814]EXU88602.1 hypothetical protein P354_28320 [Streptomyces noursei PD-1]UWS71352.1 hypothetical protein N1H47_08935 [Streptomyces noursei]GCB90162.1 hypothetical protein SALB_02864 [Streptomyces noursei]
MKAQADAVAAEAASPEPKVDAPDKFAGEEADAFGMRDLREALVGPPGDTHERLGAERDALAGLKVRAHQVIGGDQYVFSASGAPVRLAEMSAEEIDEARETHVAAADHAELTRQLAAGPRVLLLRGAQGIGKFAAARAFLVGAGHDRVYRLDPSADLTRFDAQTVGPGSGFILEDLPQAAADQLTSFDLSNLEAALRRRNGRLLLTVPSTVRLSEPDLERSIVEMAARADPGEVVHAHMRWRSGPGRATRVRRILHRNDVTALVDSLNSTPALARAAEAGRLLAELTGPDEEIARLVAERLERSELYAPHSVVPWLEELPDLATQCLALSTAVFGGEAYETVATLAERLRALLQPPETAEHPDRPRNQPFASSGSQRLRDIHATIVESEVETRHGGARGRIVRFQDPDTALQVLEDVWAEYDAVREVLPEWLRKCATHDLPTVGVRAAVAAGVLAQRSFESIRAQVLMPWAMAREPGLRHAAATALYVAAEDPAHAPAVRNLITAWSTAGTPSRLRAVAARAWRVLFENDGTEPAWALLHALAAAEELDVVDAVCTSVTEYMALDGGQHQHEALDLVDQWMASGRYGPARLFVGQLCFLYAANDLLVQGPTEAERGDAPSWPAVLRAAAGDAAVERHIAVLWESVLNSAEVYEQAQEILAKWALLVEPDDHGRRALAHLLATSVSTRRTERIIRYQAAAWARAGTGPGAPLTAREVLACLDVRSIAP